MIATAALVAVCLLNIAYIALDAHVYNNVTSSAPRGLYLAWTPRLGVGSYAFFCAPPAAAQAVRERHLELPAPDPHSDCLERLTILVKRVVGRPGDRVTFSADGVAVNGHLLPHSAPMFGLPFPHATITVPAGELVAVSSESDAWDSRYFGAIVPRRRGIWLRF